MIRRCSYEMRSKRGFADAELGEIDDEEFNFELFGAGMEIELAMKASSDLMIGSGPGIVGAELELIVNFSDLNVANSVFVFELCLKAAMASCFIVF